MGDDRDVESDEPDYRTWRDKPWYRGRPVSVVLYETPEGWRWATTTEKGGIVDGWLREPGLSETRAQHLMIDSLQARDGGRTCW
jgi:hypothetical protein